MNFYIKFKGPCSNAIRIYSFKPGLKFLDEARAKLGCEIVDVEETSTYRSDYEVTIDEQTARRCGSLFKYKRNVEIKVKEEKLNKYLLPRYSRKSDDRTIAVMEWDIDEEKLIEDFIKEARMDFSICFTGYGIVRLNFEPGLRYLDEARASLGPQIERIKPVKFQTDEVMINLDEASARKCGDLFAISRIVEVRTNRDFRQYIVFEYEIVEVDDTVARAIVSFDQDKILRDFYDAGCPLTWT
jgi:hypothetical protein